MADGIGGIGSSGLSSFDLGGIAPNGGGSGPTGTGALGDAGLSPIGSTGLTAFGLDGPVGGQSEAAKLDHYDSLVQQNWDQLNANAQNNAELLRSIAQTAELSRPPAFTMQPIAPPRFDPPPPAFPTFTLPPSAAEPAPLPATGVLPAPRLTEPLNGDATPLPVMGPDALASPVVQPNLAAPAADPFAPVDAGGLGLTSVDTPALNAFGLAGPLALPGFDIPKPAGTGPLTAAVPDTSDPMLAALGLTAIDSMRPMPLGPVGKAATSLTFNDLLAFGGGLALRGSALGTAYFALGTGNIPNDAQERAMGPDTAGSPFYADGSPRLLYGGAPVLNPAPFAEQAVPLVPPALTDGFAASTVPDATASLILPPTAMTTVPSSMAQPLPGFTPAPDLPDLEGQTPPPALHALPSFTQAPVLPTFEGFVSPPTLPPLPGFAPIDPAFGGGQISQNQINPGTLTGSLNDLTPDERTYAQERLAQGDNVTIVPRGPGRTPDFGINGAQTELKTVTSIRNQTVDGLSAAISRNLLDACGQSGTVVIDARRQPGMTLEAAEKAIGRAPGVDNVTGERLRDVKILTPNGSAIFRR